jgi:hypothetical protein
MFGVIYNSIMQNTKYDRLSKQRHINRVIKTMCHPDNFIETDYWNDMGNYTLAGGILALTYMNILALMVAVLLVFDYTRNTFIITSLSLLVSNFIVLALKSLFKSCFNIGLSKFPSIVEFLDSFYLISGVLLIIRIQDLINRYMMLLLTIPFIAMDFDKNVTLNPEPSINFSSMILGFEKNNDQELI